MIFISNPSNPTGRVLQEKEIRSLARIAQEQGLLLIVDEVYYKYLYGGIKHFSICQKALVTCPNTVAQRACIAAIKGSQDCVESMRKEYERRKRLVEQRLKGMERLSTSACEGAFYFFPRFQHSFTSREMTDYLFAKGILVRSGTEFGANGQKHFRISFATSIEKLEAGMEGLKRALDELG